MSLPSSRHNCCDILSLRYLADFEPYLVFHRETAPSFDRRFLGFGWNKVSHTMELAASGFSFMVLPDVYAVHLPHAPSASIVQ